MEGRKQKSNQVFYTSLVIVFAILLWGLAVPKNFESVANGLFDFLVGNFGWFYLLSMSSFVVFSIWIAFSKYGKIRLGKDGEEPEYSTISWFAMLFSAGMGVGLVFWGVAEPLNHFVNPLGLEGGSAAASAFAIKKSFFHWGLHPWANYAVFALALAYMQFRRDKPALVSSIFIPLIGEEKASGPIGKLVDILAVFATVAGVATSLGMATLQMTSGFNYLFGVPETDLVRVIVIGVVTILFMLSAITGLDKGIKILSNANITLAGILMLLGLILGPTVLIINNLTNGIGMYFSSLVRDSFKISSDPWYGWWTIFYWAWWIAWAPFVGTFIARISRGRTIKEFIGGVLLAPTLASFIWFAIFGTLGINTGLDVASKAIKSTPTAFFVVLENYPMGSIISFIAVILLSTFFVTSADSATFVLGMMSSNGDLNPTTKRKVTWGFIQSGLAVTLMLAGGLEMLQTASIAAAFPFAFIMLFGMVSLIKALRQDVRKDSIGKA
ncbi:glycine betaine uptake BCCT transporter [Selenihalanaerobacter shriftii]|uniref:Glycine betaine transporter n=1 Tax=Selenihalanaerobacter shriftii TaxID=142842 RepID=A0A1T4QZW1_9FIRM|nr:BCCT family transporter [Selenihalanaerobacter shriftii]SKA09166.1 glycine betaine transporter [Selenihalanaerobacter shriftii]